MKPKKMPVTFENWLRAVAAEDAYAPGYDAKEARTILAALEYERQRTETLLDNIAAHAKSFGSTPRGRILNSLLKYHGRAPTAVNALGEATEATEAELRAWREEVIPKPRKSPEIEASYARERNIARRKKLTAP